MKIKGIINAVYPMLDKEGKQRSFTTRDNEKFICYNVEVDVKRYDERGNEYKDELLLEYNKKEEENNPTPFADLVNVKAEVECSVAFSRSEWQGRKFMTSRLFAVTKKES